MRNITDVTSIMLHHAILHILCTAHLRNFEEMPKQCDVLRQAI